MKNKDYVHMCDTYHLQEEDDFFGEKCLDCCSIDKILDAKYEKLDIQEVLLKQNQLNDSQKQDLKTCLKNMKKHLTGLLLPAHIWAKSNFGKQQTEPGGLVKALAECASGSCSDAAGQTFCLLFLGQTKNWARASFDRSLSHDDGIL